MEQVACIISIKHIKYPPMDQLTFSYIFLHEKACFDRQILVFNLFYYHTNKHVINDQLMLNGAYWWGA